MPKILTYPKQDFNKTMVLREIRQFQYPKAWRYSSDKRNHYLILDERLFARHYVTDPRTGKSPRYTGSIDDILRNPLRGLRI